MNNHLIIPKAQAEGRREKEGTFEHGGQRLNFISPVTVSSKSSPST